MMKTLKIRDNYRKIKKVFQQNYSYVCNFVSISLNFGGFFSLTSYFTLDIHNIKIR